ncbi:MAG: OmpA family protein [Ignavibacteria bacterium]|nr:OmpA family protein [Ignavibacteria bacterium]
MQKFKTFSLISLYLFLCILISQSLFSQNTKENDETALSNQMHLIAMKIEPSEGQSNIIASRRIRIINLGPVVNWQGLDYAPTISADGRTLYFVSNRPGSKLTPDGKPSHDFWAAKKLERLDSVFFQPYNIDTTTNYGRLGVNTELNEGVASISADGRTLYFTGCNRPDGIGDCDIYKTTIEGDRWGRPVNLGKNINSEVFDSQPSIAPDQSRLYFVSTRKGPNSDGRNVPKNFDIWYSDWDYDLEEWKPAKNLEAINTKGREVSPFIAADNQTLFFASDGHKPNYGGLDFYVTRYDPVTKTWSTPENLGEPINTKEDEMFITLPASGDILYFSSRRTDIPSYQGDYDIFMAFVPTFFRAVNVAGTVVDECTGEFIPAKIEIKNPITGRIYTDSLNLQRTKFEYVVTNSDYGEGKESADRVQLEISAFNPKYGKRSVFQEVIKPKKTDDPEEAKKFADEINVKILMGQRPVLTAEIDEADYIKRAKVADPKLASYRGLVMEEVQTWDLYPLLNYVFFDLGSSVLPPRYILFKSPEEAKNFTDTTIAGGTLNKYYHVLNIYGYRLNKFPDAKIEIVGTTDGTTPEEKRVNLSKERAEFVYNYFKNIWKISPDRMKLTFRDKPLVVSNLKDSLGIQENRRVEILCDDWNITKPVFDKDPTTFPQPEEMKFVIKNGIDDAIIAKRRIEIKRGNEKWMTLNNIGLTEPNYTWDWTNEDGKYPKDEVPYTAQLIVTTKSGAECSSDPITIPVKQISTLEKKTSVVGDSTLERYNLILFPFNSAEAGETNNRIMREYVYDRVKPTSVAEVVGHTDVVGLFDHNLKLSERRAETVRQGIIKATGGRYATLNSKGVGEDDPLYTNDLPEGRFYNRTVQVVIRTPVSEYEK